MVSVLPPPPVLLLLVLLASDVEGNLHSDCYTQSQISVTGTDEKTVYENVTVSSNTTKTLYVIPEEGFRGVILQTENEKGHYKVHISIPENCYKNDKWFELKVTLNKIHKVNGVKFTVEIGECGESCLWKDDLDKIWNLKVIAKEGSRWRITRPTLDHCQLVEVQHATHAQGDCKDEKYQSRVPFTTTTKKTITTTTATTTSTTPSTTSTTTSPITTTTTSPTTANTTSTTPSTKSTTTSPITTTTTSPTTATTTSTTSSTKSTTITPTTGSTSLEEWVSLGTVVVAVVIMVTLLGLLMIVRKKTPLKSG